jgi:putative heme-binding domain-containing protein
MRLAGIWKMKTLRGDLEAAARDRKLGDEVRIAAVEGVGEWKDGEARGMLATLAKDESAAVRAAGISALAAMDLDAAARLASETELGPALWAKVFTAFLQRQGGAVALATAFDAKKPEQAVAEVALRVMNESGRRDETLVKALSPATVTKLTLTDVPELVKEVRSRGNAERGQQVYQRAELGCVNCHSVQGFGGKLGPDLGALGTAQPVDFIIGAILDPQREVKEGFAAISISTKDGDEFQGYAVREDGREIVLRDILQNEEVTIRKSEIQQRRQSGSVMPSGLADGLTRGEFVDMVLYLSELGK